MRAKWLWFDAFFIRAGLNALKTIFRELILVIDHPFI